MGKQREDGEKKEETGKLSVPCELSVPFSPARAHLISPLPIPQPTGKLKETSTEERVTQVCQ